MTLKMRNERSDGSSFEMDAETCEQCKGIGYLTAQIRYFAKAAGDSDFVDHTAKSGEKCPLCNGRGMVGVAGRGWRPR